jgi:signal peptidase II
MTEHGVPAPADAGPVDPHPGSASGAGVLPPSGGAPSDGGPAAGADGADAGDVLTAVEASGVSAHASSKRWSWSMLAVAATVIALDQLTKWWAQRTLADGHSVHVVGSVLQLALTYNSGMAFSRGTGLGPVIGVVAIVVIVVLLASLRRESSTLARVALAAVLGGAVGNLLDRLFRAGDGFLGGSVVDFIRLPHWPYFNVADMGVTLGGLTLVLGSWRAGRPRPAAETSAP